MLNFRKKIKKNLQNKIYSTLYYLYIKNKFFINCATYQNSFFFINYLLILEKFNFIVKFKTLKTSKNLKKLNLNLLIINSIYFSLNYIPNISLKLFKNYKKILLKNYYKMKDKFALIRSLKSNLLFNKRWNQF